MSDVVYLDTSAILRAVLETGTTPDIERQIGEARYLVTSRLALVESARALIRLRLQGIAEERLADAGRELDAIWARCTVWELTPAVCELATQVAPGRALRTLDALHVSTYLLARRHLGDVVLLSTDTRLKEAAASA